jgi:hypothetical protein
MKYLDKVAHVVVGDALVDVDTYLAGPIDKLDGQTFEKFFRRQLKNSLISSLKTCNILQT